MEAASVIEWLGRDGQVRMVHKVSHWPVTIGRSAACDLVLDDSHLAAVHAELLQSADGVELHLLPSLNGGWLGQRRLLAGETVALQGPVRFRLGATQLRWRSAADLLVPEQLLHGQGKARFGNAGLALLLALWIALLWADQWAGLNPGAPWVDYSNAMLSPLALLLGWAGLWSLVTQLFQHRFPFALHLRRALVGLTSLHLIGLSLPLLAYALSQPRLMVLDALLFPIGMAGLLWWHAGLVWPRAKRWLAGLLASLLLLGLVLNIARRQEQQHWLGPAYLSALPPPLFRLAEPLAPAVLVNQLRSLQAELARQAAKDNDSAAVE